ncbi:hypothetical protein [Saccharospirillum alexandrii]|uniref:hypothetical protein n=1 Tax=Saccharospirillum alexandrii TaxID=2448477 RepID=UPI0016CC83C1
MHLPLRLSLPMATLAALVIHPTAWADPGALDRFDCHNDAVTGEYHCHGDEALADLGGFAIGAGVRSSVWVYPDESEYDAFVGPSLDIEAGIGAFALQGSYHYKQIVTSDSDVYLIGWDIGAKLGRGVARYGTKYYGSLGYYSESVEQDGFEDTQISGFYVGGGGGYNWDELGLDIQADWHFGDNYEEFFNGNVDVQTISIRTVLSYRF